MLRRQKAILALLAEADSPVSRTALVKRAFLLRQETHYKTDSAFYDFLPYKYGPFSFALYRELEALERDGYITASEDALRLAPAAKGAAAERVSEMTREERESVSVVTQRYGRFAQIRLLRDIYRRYPYYSINTERTDLLPSSVPEPAVADPATYTAGYEGDSVDSFFNKLLQSGIRGIIDVRANPVSRKYGFAGSSLARISGKLGIAYIHFSSLGIPSEHRAGLGTEASYRKLLDRYEKQLSNHSTSIAEASAEMAKTPSVLVCMERDVKRCHRSRLAKAVSAKNGLAVHHL